MKFTPLAVLTMCLLAVFAQAEIVEATPNVTILKAPPITAIPNTRSSVQSDNIQVFAEKQGVVAQHGVPGVTPGTRVNSYFIHYDPNLLQRRFFELDRVFAPPAQITFSETILAVFGDDAELDSTDHVFGNAPAYPDGFFYRGIEGPENSDVISFKGRVLTIRRLFVRDSATEPGTDQLRVITAARRTSAPGT
jgi:hypothetical protein